MSENRMKEELQSQETEQEATASKPRSRKPRGSRNFIRFINIFDWFDRDQMARNMPFILFLTALVMLYIANSYYSERLIRDIDKTKLELKEKSAEYITLRSRLMYNSKRSEVAGAAAPMQLRESVEPPVKLIISNTSPRAAR